MNNNSKILSLFMLKPESFVEPYDKIVYSTVVDKINKHGLNIIATKEVKLTEFIMRSFQPSLNQPSEYGDEWKKAVLDGIKEAERSALVLLVEGEDSINKCLQIKKEIRKELVNENDAIGKIAKNFVHCIDDTEDLILDIQVLFPKSLVILNQKVFVNKNTLNQDITKLPRRN